MFLSADYFAHISNGHKNGASLEIESSYNRIKGMNILVLSSI